MSTALNVGESDFLRETNRAVERQGGRRSGYLDPPRPWAMPVVRATGLTEMLTREHVLFCDVLKECALVHAQISGHLL